MTPAALLLASENLRWREAPSKAVEIANNNREKLAELFEKRGYSPWLDQLGQSMNLWKGQYAFGIPNHPSPLTSMLVSGMGGLGLGYGLGALGEKILPERWQRNRLRRTMAMLGAAAGTMPGLAWGFVNNSSGRPFNSSELFQERVIPPPPKPFTHPGLDKVIDHIETDPGFLDSIENAGPVPAIKESATDSGLMQRPLIDVEQFTWEVYNDPRIAGPMSMPEQAAAAGTLMGAANLPGKEPGTRFVSPMDIGRLAAGMGSGYVSGALVGKALGLMAGMPDSTQNLLKNTGMWAGVIKNVLPIIFGGEE